MPRFNSINFYQNGPKIKIFFLKKYKIFERCASGGWGALPLDPPQPVDRWGLSSPTPPKISLTVLKIAKFFGYAPDQKICRTKFCARSRNRKSSPFKFCDYMQLVLINFIIPQQNFSGFATTRMAVGYGYVGTVRLRLNFLLRSTVRWYGTRFFL